MFFTLDSVLVTGNIQVRYTKCMYVLIYIVSISLSFRCVILMIFLPVISNVTDGQNTTHYIDLQSNLNLAGFVTITIIQIATVSFLIIHVVVNINTC